VSVGGEGRGEGGENDARRRTSPPVSAAAAGCLADDAPGSIPRLSSIEALSSGTCFDRTAFEPSASRPSAHKAATVMRGRMSAGGSGARPTAAGPSIAAPTGARCGLLVATRGGCPPPPTLPPWTRRCAVAVLPLHPLLCPWQTRRPRRGGRWRSRVAWRAARSPAAAMATGPPPPADVPSVGASPPPAPASPSKRPRGGPPDGRDLYSVLLPTYNERENLPLMVALLVKAFEETVRWG